nr:hypothetical protein BaRGS_006093 [Batillaria attramentaria]
MAGDQASQAMDAVFMALGWRGRFQMVQIVQWLLCVFPLAYHILSVVFIAKDNPHKCREVNNSSSVVGWPDDVINVTYGKCSVTLLNVSGESLEMPCPQGLEFADPVDHSMMSEWELVCENEALSDVSQTLLLLGMCVGAVLFTSLADKYGRKPFTIGCQVGLMVTAAAQAFVPNFFAFLPLRFFLGAFQQGTGLTAGILSLEVLPTQFRYTQSVAGCFLWSFAMVFMATVAFLMRDLPWRYLQLAFAIFSLYCLLQIWFSDESLRWLVANGKIKRAERVLKRAARMNGANEQDVLTVFREKALKHAHHPIDTSSKLKPPHADGQQNGALVPEEEADTTNYNILDFFRHRRVFVCACINGFAWMVNAMTYYGLSMTSVTLADDMYVGFLLSALVELPTAVAFFFMVEKVGRKRGCDVFHLVAGFSLLLSVALPAMAGEGNAVQIVVIVLSLLGKFAISVSFAILFLYTPEQFPTNLRVVTTRGLPASYLERAAFYFLF